MATKLRGSQIIAGSIPEAQFDAAFLTRMGGIDTLLASLGTNKADLTYVDQSIADLVASAPETLNTLNELSTALANDPNFATTITTEIGTKADQTALDTEITRATTAEGALSGRLTTVEGADTVVGSIAYAVKAETDRALGVEGGLNTRLTSAEGSVTTITADELTSGSIAFAVKAEETRATGVEGGLNTRLTSAEGSITTLEADNLTAGSVAFQVKAETDRATGVESGLDTRLTSAEGSITTLEADNLTAGSVAFQIKAETDRATGVESGLDTRLSAIENDATYIKESDIVKGAAFTETPDGTRTAFTLVSGDTMLSGTVQVMVNGLETYAGASEDWVLAGDNKGIVFNSAPQTGDKIRAHYFKG